MDVFAVEVAKRILNITEHFEIRMTEFIGADSPSEVIGVPVHECKTTFCIAGYLAHKDNYPKKYRIHGDDPKPFAFDYHSYSYALLGRKGRSMVNNSVWSWFFSSAWDDSIEQAKFRAQYVVDNGYVPQDYISGTHTGVWFLKDLGYVPSK